MWQKVILGSKKPFGSRFFVTNLMLFASQLKSLIGRKIADRFTWAWQTMPLGLNLAMHARRFRFVSNLSKKTQRLISNHKSNFALDSVKFIFFKKIIIVVPLESSNNWENSKGNWFYEIYASGLDFFPDHEIELFYIKDHGSVWPDSLREKVSQNPQTSILSFIENTDSDNLSGVTFEHLIKLREIWNGVLIGVIFDSVWPQTLNHAFLLADMDKGVVIVTIDRSIKTALPRSSNQCGPLFLPISRETIESIRNTVISTSKSIKFSFIGNKYLSRVNSINLISNYIQDFDYMNEINERPDYMTYITKLASSQFTLNLARANSQSMFQLKCRVLEAALVGTIVVTDEKKFISSYLPKSCFIYFRHPRDILFKINQYELARSNIQIQLQVLGESIAPKDFWNKIWKCINTSEWLEVI